MQSPVEYALDSLPSLGIRRHSSEYPSRVLRQSGLSVTVHFAQQPQSRGRPFSLHSGRGNFQCFGSLVDGETGKESQFNQPRLSLVKDSERVQGIVERNQIHLRRFANATPSPSSRVSQPPPRFFARFILAWSTRMRRMSWPATAKK